MLIWLLMAMVHAMPMPIVADERKTGHYLQQGVFIGGEQGRPISLLNLKLGPSSPELERVIIIVGESSGDPLKGRMPFYHVSVDGKRVVIDIAQLNLTRIETDDVKARLRRSQFVDAVDFTMDPEDNSTNLTLMLKKAVSLEVMSHEKSGELILDLKGQGA